MSTTGVSFKIGADNSDAIKALKELRDEFKTLRNQLKSAVTDIKIKVSADTTSLNSEISSIRNRIKSQIGQIDVDVKVKADNASIAASATHIKNQLRAALGTVDIALNLSANQTSLNAELLQIKNRINAYFATGVAVRIVPTLISADAAAARVRLQGLVNNTYQARVGINLAYLNSQIALARTMLTSLGSGVNINVDATASNLIHALNELRDEVKRLRSSMSGSGGGGGPSGGAGANTGVLAGLKANIASLMAVATGGVFAAITVGTAEYVRELERASQLTNVSTQEMQQLTYAASTVGFSMEKLSDVYKDVNDKVGDFLTTGGGELKDFFEKIAPKVGVTAEQFYNLSGPDALQLFFDSLQKANVSQAEMIFYMESIANDASVLIPLLKDNGAEFQRLAEQAQKLGIILDDVSISKVKAFQSAFGQVKNTVAGLTTVLGVELAPTLTDISNRFVEFAVENADGIRDTLGSMADLFTDILSVADLVFTEIGSLWSDLTGSIEDGIGAQIGFFDLLSAAFEGVGLAFRVVALLIKSLIEIVKDTVRDKVLDIIDYFNKFSSGLNQLKIVATFALDSLVIAFQSFSNVVQSAFSLDWNGVKNNWNNGLNQLKVLANQKQKELLAEQQDLKTKLNVTQEQRDDNAKQRNTNIKDAADKLIGDWFTRQLERNNPKPAPTFNKTGGSGFKGGGYVAPADDKEKKKEKAKKDKADADARRAAEDAAREAEALARAEYEHKQAMLKIGLNNIQFEYDQNKKSLEDYYNIKRQYILESSQLEIAELERRSKLAKNASEKQQIATKIKEIENNRDLDLNKLDVFKRDKTYSNINKETDQILGNQAYQDKYADIQTKMNPMKKLEIDENNRNNKLATIAQLKEQMTKLQDLQNSEGGENIEGLTEKIQSLDIATKELQSTSLTTFQQMGQDIQQAAGAALASGINTFFNDLIEGSKSAGEALKDFVRNFIKSIAQIIIQAMAAYAALLILNAIPGGAAVAGALDMASTGAKAAKGTKSASSTPVQTKELHTGGVVKRDGKQRKISKPSDIKSNEVIAILEDDEEVITRNDPRHINNFDMNAHIAKIMPRYTAGGVALAGDSALTQTINNFNMQQQAGQSSQVKQPQSISVNTYVGDQFIADAMGTPAGEKAFLNVVGRNATAIRYLLDNN